jgi:hypothetical protein
MIIKYKEQVTWIIALMSEVECLNRDNILLISISRNVKNFINKIFIKPADIFIFY